MKNTSYLNSCKAIIWLQLIVFASLQANAQYEDKSYLKKGVTQTNNSTAIPDSKYGAVVSQHNLDEALKNPDKYRSANFYQAGLTAFPEQLFLFKNLEQIDLSSNQLTALTNRLTEFKLLKELYVNNNKLTALGTEIANCTQLQVLQVQNNPLTTISTDIAKLNSLQEFLMGGIAPQCTIPAQFWTLSNLKKLEITNSNIIQIPAEIKNLTQLESLNLLNNSITSIPEELYSLKMLTSLNVGYNSINSISSNIAKLENLNFFGIFHNPIATMPQEITTLKNLNFLSCWKTNITQKEIDKIKARLPKAKVNYTGTDVY